MGDSHLVLAPALRERGKPNIMYKSLRPMLKVALEILEYNDVDGKSVHFSRLVSDLEGRVSRVAVHEALDSLIDQGTVHAEWEENSEGHWIRVYRISGEEAKRQFRLLYSASHDS